MGLNIKAIIRVCSLVMIFTGCMTIVPAIVSLIYGEINTALIFILCAVPYALIGTVIFFKIKPGGYAIKARDGILAISLVWFTTIFLGAVTLYSTADISIVDAIFESTSGFTTTGATVISDVESLPKGVLFFRAFSHWIGGLGIILLVISIFPLLGSGGNNVARAEASRTMTEKITSKYTDTAKHLAFYYISMTFLSTILLLFGEMNFFDSITHSMSTVSTGGFSNFNEGLTQLDSMYSLWVIMIFMLFGSINFALYHFLFSYRWKEFFQDTEFRWFITIIIAGCIMVTANIFIQGDIAPFSKALTHGCFNFISNISTTGFASTDYNLWPSFSKMLILVIMIMGGCSASTAGGIKVYRVAVALKLIKRNLSRRLHPSAMISISNDEGPMRSDFVSAVAAYIFLYVGVIFIGTFFLSVENKDLITTISSVITCMGNIGPGFGSVGPLENMSVFSSYGKLILSFCMLAGRLELFGFILLFTRRFWNPSRVRV